MFVIAHTIAMHITSSSMQAYIKKSNHPHKPLVLWVLQMINQLSILLAHPFRHTRNTFLVAQDKIDVIATNKFMEAFDLLNNFSAHFASSKAAWAPSFPAHFYRQKTSSKQKLWLIALPDDLQPVTCSPG